MEQDARVYAESIVDTVQESLLILDKDLRVISANSSFYKTFQVSPEETLNKFIYDIGSGQWDIPRLRELLEEILPGMLISKISRLTICSLAWGEKQCH